MSFSATQSGPNPHSIYLSLPDTQPATHLVCIHTPRVLFGDDKLVREAVEELLLEVQCLLQHLRADHPAAVTAIRRCGGRDNSEKILREGSL